MLTTYIMVLLFLGHFIIYVLLFLIIYNIIPDHFFFICRELKRIPYSPNRRTCQNYHRTSCIWTTWSSRPESGCASKAPLLIRWLVCLTTIKMRTRTVYTGTTAVVSSLTVYQTFQVPRLRRKGSSRSRWSWTDRSPMRFTT